MAFDPTRDIVDPHHHLWPADFRGGLLGAYELDELRADTATVPGVVETVFVECGAAHRTGGPEHLRCVGETEFVAGIADASEASAGATVAAIVPTADLSLPLDVLDEVLDAHADAAGGRFRGIRDALAGAPPDTPLLIPGDAAADKAAQPAFRRGVGHLGDRGLTYDTWQHHVQTRDLLDLARAVPGTTMVLDHVGTPLGVGPWEGRADEVFDAWSADIDALAACENVVVKVGGLAMPDCGYGWHVDPAARPSSAEVVAAHGRWYRHVIDRFGPDRCMLESNFPVDKLSLDYDVLWEALGTIAGEYGAAEQDALFAGTARRVYRL